MTLHHLFFISARWDFEKKIITQLPGEAHQPGTITLDQNQKYKKKSAWWRHILIKVLCEEFKSTIHFAEETKFHLVHCTLDRMTMKLTRRLLGYMPLCSLVCSHRTLIPFLCIACFARALLCTHLFTHWVTHSLQSSWEQSFCLWNKRVDFTQF